MADTETGQLSETIDHNIEAIEVALAQARRELGAMTQAASAAEQHNENATAEYSLHDVEGMGRYAIVRRTGWRPLLHVISDRKANIDFSANVYPNFDGVIGQHFKSPYLLDPLHDKFGSYHHLRENIAAVRNFLMETYYVDTPPGMTPEKAKRSLGEIATFVGKGLNNNYLFFGVIPNHHPNEPFISINEASRTGGAGAQYLYEKILEMHRQSNWVRPFSAIVALFGGKPAQDWMLPPAEKTEFTALFETDIAPPGAAAAIPGVAAIQAEMAHINQLEAARQQLRDSRQMLTLSADLDAIGNHLLYTATNMQKVHQLSEPVQREAIDIARDILRKLKIAIGSINIMDGLKLRPTDDLATFGGLKGVALVYERMVAYARAVDPGVLQHPSVIAATQAIGQMGYLAKVEAVRMVRMGGHGRLAQSMTNQLGRVHAAYASTSEATMGELVDKVEQGMNTLLSRVQTISGPGIKVGAAATNDVGIAASPTAGLAMQASATGQRIDAALKQNAQLAAQQAMAVQQQQVKTTAKPTPSIRQETVTSQSRPTMGRQSVQNSRSQQQQRPAQSSSKSSAPTTQAGISQQQQANTQQYQQERQEHEEQDRLNREAETRRLQAAQAKMKAAAMKIDPNMLSGLNKSMSNAKALGVAVNPGSKGSFASSLQTTKPQGAPKPEDKDKYPAPPPPTPGKGTGGRGF